MQITTVVQYLEEAAQTYMTTMRMNGYNEQALAKLDSLIAKDRSRVSDANVDVLMASITVVGHIYGQTIVHAIAGSKWQHTEQLLDSTILLPNGNTIAPFEHVRTVFQIPGMSLTDMYRNSLI